MNKILYVKCDLFEYIEGQQNIIIPHVVNNQGAFGSGFVVPLGKRFPEAKSEYFKWVNQINYPWMNFVPFELGNIHVVEADINNDIWVVHMCAQTLCGNRPLFYNKLVDCMESVACGIQQEEIVAPKFGSGLAGGNWNIIEELINDCWIRKGIKVTICEL